MGGSYYKRSMLPFLETIAVSEGHYLNLPYHNKRYNATLLRFFNSIPDHSLADLLPSPPKSNELIRCRVTYNLDLFKVEFPTICNKRDKHTTMH